MIQNASIFDFNVWDLTELYSRKENKFLWVSKWEPFVVGSCLLSKSLGMKQISFGIESQKEED